MTFDLSCFQKCCNQDGKIKDSNIHFFFKNAADTLLSTSSHLIHEETKHIKAMCTLLLNSIRQSKSTCCNNCQQDIHSSFSKLLLNLYKYHARIYLTNNRDNIDIARRIYMRSLCVLKVFTQQKNSRLCAVCIERRTKTLYTQLVLKLYSTLPKNLDEIFDLYVHKTKFDILYKLFR